jgi:hypothetical protein
MCIRRRGKAFTELLPSNDSGIHIETHRLMEGFMKYAVELGSAAIIYIYIYIMTVSYILVLSLEDCWEGNTQTYTHRTWCLHKPTLIYF